MEKQTFILAHPTARRNASAAVLSAADGYMVTITEPKRKQIQNEKFHAMIGDIAKQCLFMGKRQDTETWKRLLVDAFSKAKQAEGDPLPGHGQIVPALDGMGFVQLGIQTRSFNKRHAAEFIESLYAYGADHDVVWSKAAGDWS